MFSYCKERLAHPGVLCSTRPWRECAESARVAPGLSDLHLLYSRSAFGNHKGIVETIETKKPVLNALDLRPTPRHDVKRRPSVNLLHLVLYAASSLIAA